MEGIFIQCHLFLGAFVGEQVEMDMNGGSSYPSLLVLKLCLPISVGFVPARIRVLGVLEQSLGTGAPRELRLVPWWHIGHYHCYQCWECKGLHGQVTPLLGINPRPVPTLAHLWCPPAELASIWLDNCVIVAAQSVASKGFFQSVAEAFFQKKHLPS